MDSYEVEIKSLLGEKANADKLLEKMKADPTFESLGSHKQLNHYFKGGNLKMLYGYVKPHIELPLQKQFEKLTSFVADFSVRTRRTEIATILVIKAAQDDTTSSNGTARMEFEAKVDMPLEQLDEMLLKSGFEYLSKWSRERQEFKYRGMNVTIDKNAGYGYLAEFEKVANDPSQVEAFKIEIRNNMQLLGATELPQDRLARMFDYYNAHWNEYYGTDKVFNIE